MSEVIIDNLGLASCGFKLDCFEKKCNNCDGYFCNSSLKSKKTISLCWQNFITSIVLWDKVRANTCYGEPLFEYKSDPEFYISDILLAGHSISILEYKGMETLNKYLNNEEVFQTNRLFDEESISKDIYSELEKAWYTTHKNKHLLYDDELSFRGYIYALQANLLGSNYLPHPMRAQELKESGLFSYPLNANYFLDIIDKEVYDFIDALNRENNGEIRNIRFPLLYEFISRNANNPKEEIELALELRKQNSVKNFRKSIDEIDKSLEKGNYLEVKAATEQVKQVCADIENQIYKKQKGFILTLGFTPKITGPKFTASFQRNKPDNATQIIKSKKIHTTFLCNLAKFGYMGKNNFPKRMWNWDDI